jgi:hypothetical protein
VGVGEGTALVVGAWLVVRAGGVVDVRVVSCGEVVVRGSVVPVCCPEVVVGGAWVVGVDELVPAGAWLVVAGAVVDGADGALEICELRTVTESPLGSCTVV